MKFLKFIYNFIYRTWYGCLASWCVCALTLLATMALPSLFPAAPAWLEYVAIGLIALLLLLSLSFFGAVVVSLATRHWWRAVLQIVLAPLALSLLFSGMAAVTVLSMFGPDNDNFNEGLTIPEGLACAEPQGGAFGLCCYPHNVSAADVSDPFAARMLAAVPPKGATNATARAAAPLDFDLSVLDRLAAQHEDRLMAYLAAHPAWWVHEDHGALLATRRWKIRGVWRHDLNGHYSGEDYQTLTTLAFSDRRTHRCATKAPLVGTVTVRTEEGNIDHQASELVLRGKHVSVSVFEETLVEDRLITRAALEALAEEFARLEATSDVDVRKLLPEDAVLRGETSFELYNGLQGGIYDAVIRANPGEPGTVYLKAFEVTKGTPLSARRLAECTSERIGWSADPAEKFLSEVDFTIYEGDWGKYYAARFEVWFRPASGGEERKLMERVYKIEGWER